MKNNIYYVPKTKEFRLDIMSNCAKYGVPSDIRLEPNNIGIYKAHFGTFATINDRLGWHYFDVYFTQEELDFFGFDMIVKSYCKHHNFEVQKSIEVDEIDLCYIQKVKYPKERTIHWWIQHIEIPKDKYDKIRKELGILNEYE